MSGVIREILESEGGSAKGEEDFFSVAKTIPFVARESSVSKSVQLNSFIKFGRTFNSKGSDTLVDRVQSIL